MMDPPSDRDREVLKKYAGRRPKDAGSNGASGEPGEPGGPGGPGESPSAASPREGPFSARKAQLGGKQSEIMLDVHVEAGTRYGLPYIALIALEFDPSEGIVLHFSSHRVQIFGRRLDSLYKALLLHQVAWVQVADGAGTSITRIDVEENM